MGLSGFFNFLFFFILLSSRTLFAQAVCGPISKDLSKLPEGLFIENCKKLRASEACQRTEANIKEAGNNPNDKLIQCTKSGLEREKIVNENSLASSISCLIGVAEFGIDTINTLGTFLGESTAKLSIAVDKTNERNSKCEKDPTGKKKLFLIHNLLHPKLLQLPIPSDETLKQYSCNQLEFEIRKITVITRTKIESKLVPKIEKNPQMTLPPEESQYANWLDSNIGRRQPSTPLIENALKLIKEAGAEYWCYDAVRKRAMMCEAAAMAASLYVGGRAIVASASNLKKIRDVGGLSNRVAKSEMANLGRVSADRASTFLKGSGIKFKKVNIDGAEYTAVVPDKSGHWLARQAEVYSRKYDTDFVLVDPKVLSADTPAQVFADGSRNYLMLANNLDFADIPEVMGIISHEMVHARVAAAATNTAVKANPPMTLGKGSRDIPISGYAETLALDEVQAYSATAQTYKRSMEMARDTGDFERYEKFRKMYLFNKDKAVKIHQHTTQALERVKARVVADQNLTPVDMGNSWGIRINSSIKQDEEMMGIVLPKTKATNDNFRQELLKRIQTEIDTNRQIISTLTGN